LRLFPLQAAEFPGRHRPQLTKKPTPVGEIASATMVVADDRKDVDPKLWTHGHFGIIRAAAQDPLVQRIFVNAAIKKAL
jgi:murein endopeptidase